jgi:hypothetical protein
MESYYIALEKPMLRDFDRSAKFMRQVMRTRGCYPKAAIKGIMQDARREYQMLIPQIPFVGGKENPLTWNLVMAAQFLAFYKTMKARGESVETIGTLSREALEAWLKRIPKFLLRLRGKWQTTRWYYYFDLKRRAARSQERRFADDWVYTAVKGDGKTFTYGVDYSQCAICKFFSQQDAAELIPYMCALDYPLAQAMGLELIRTETIGTGGIRCDFRIKRVAQPVQA